MANDDFVEIVDVIVVVAGCAQNFEGQIADYRRRSMIQEQKFPLQAVPRGELGFSAVHN